MDDHYKPERNTFAYVIYVDLVVGHKLRLAGFAKERRREMFGRIARDRKVPRRFVRRIWDRAIRPRLRDGVNIRDFT